MTKSALGEEENGLRDILGRADATEKRLARAPLLLAGLDSDRARRDPADADLGRERAREDPGQHRLGRFRRAVGAKEGQGS